MIDDDRNILDAEQLEFINLPATNDAVMAMRQDDIVSALAYADEFAGDGALFHEVRSFWTMGAHPVVRLEHLVKHKPERQTSGDDGDESGIRQFAIARIRILHLRGPVAC
jgi:hypothetical protein